MIDLTGPARAWPATLASRFVGAQERGMRSVPWWRTPAPHGDPPLVERLADLFGAPLDRTFVTGGVRHFAACWAGRTRCACVEAPTFADIPGMLGRRGLVRRISWAALTDGQLERAGPGTIWLTDPYRNPDGRCLTAPQWAAIADLVGQGHTAVINQVYRWFAPEDWAPGVPAGAWAVTSLAKLAGGGVRLGWATAPSADDITQELTSGGPPTAWQRAWAEFLDRPTFRALCQTCVEPTLDARRGFVDWLEESLGWTIPGGGFSLLLDCVGIDEKCGVDLLARSGVNVSPGSAFGCTGPSVRVAFSGVTVSESKRAAEIFARLQARFRPSGLALRGYRRGPMLSLSSPVDWSQ